MADINRVFRKGDVCEFLNQNWIIVSDISFNQKQEKCYAFLLEKDIQKTSNKINAALEGFYLELYKSKYLINNSSCTLICNKSIGDYKGTYENTEVVPYLEKLFLDMMKDMYSSQEINIILNGYDVIKCDKIVNLTDTIELEEKESMNDLKETKPKRSTSNKTSVKYNTKVSRYIKNLTKNQAKLFVNFYNSNSIKDVIIKYSLDNEIQLRKIKNKCIELLGKSNCNFDTIKRNKNSIYKGWSHSKIINYIDYYNNHTDAETYIQFYKNDENFSIVKASKRWCEDYLLKVNRTNVIEPDSKSETIIDALQKSEFVSTAKRCIYESTYTGGGTDN